MAPLEGAIDLAASLGSLVLVMVMVMEMVLMVLNVRLCTWDRADRERNGGHGGQNESKFPHKNAPWTGFLSAQKMAKASARVKQIFMNARSGRRVFHLRFGRSFWFRRCPVAVPWSFQGYAARQRHHDLAHAGNLRRCADRCCGDVELMIVSDSNQEFAYVKTRHE